MTPGLVRTSKPRMMKGSSVRLNPSCTTIPGV
ncbi:Uncharacterised protein [Bordetella pertussis]|nr:Uncharacterised protein [Bordetella pertussis]CFP65431.1 Uncharacterised protein [Bordetella pertussis]